MGKPLSIMPYFGGKARMADFIAKRLDYSTSTLVSIFGGACRVLLNKPPHEHEYYNDYGSGVCAVMEVLSKPDTAQEFIDRLYYETEYSAEQFNWAKEIYDLCEIDIEQQYKDKLKRLLTHKDNRIVSIVRVKEFMEYMRQEADEMFLVPTLAIYKSRKKLMNLLKTNDIFKEEFHTAFNDWIAFYKLREENNGVIPRARDIDIDNVDIEIDEDTQGVIISDKARTEIDKRKTISNMDLAIATYIVFTFGFSGTGQGFTGGKFKNDDEYKKHILKLYPCADRMQGVQVLQMDAMSFFNHDLYYDVKDQSEYQNTLFVKWLLNPDIMILADPSYIDPRHEAELLKNEKKGIDIDINAVDSVSQAIKEAWDGKKMPNNLGKCYTRSFGYEEQEKFLQAVCHAQCKMLICNYDLELYNKYLNEETGWTKEVYPTTTSASGSSGDNERLECIWYNY